MLPRLASLLRACIIIGYASDRDCYDGDKQDCDDVEAIAAMIEQLPGSAGVEFEQVRLCGSIRVAEMLVRQFCAQDVC